MVSQNIHAPSPEQQDVIDHWGQGMAVLAGAGSGKTTTLVTKCLRLLERKPEARFVAVSFTERSASDLRGKLSKSFVRLGNPSALNQHWVTTIHGLCGSVLKEFPREAGFDGEESILPEAEAYLLWERALESLWYDEIPPQLEKDLELLLDRESRSGLIDLIDRVRELVPFGVFDSLKQESQGPEPQALERISRFLVEKYQALKQRQGVLDFSDLEKGADRALEFAHVRQAYQFRFELILIDEFQDTNPVQARILWRMARPDLSNLCVVGDPKQSIYRFRDADVSVFQEYCAQLPVHYSLTWNFRSRPGIIDYVNQVCAKTFQNSEIPFEALIPQRPAGEGESVVRLDVQNPLELGRWILGEVKKGIPLHDMALLVRRVRGNESWLKALSSCGIPIAVGSGGLFWESPRVRELMALLRWWDNPANTLSGAVFLRAPWMRGEGRGAGQGEGKGAERDYLNDTVIDEWIKADPTMLRPFLNSSHPIAKRLKGLRGAQVRPGEVLMALIQETTASESECQEAASDDRSSLTLKLQEELAGPLLGLWHRVENLSSRGMDFHAVVLELTAAIEEGRREREVPAPRNQGQLTVLTLHGSKGLEFKHVILIDFSKKARSSDAPLLFWDRTQGAYLAQRDDKGQRSKKSPVENTWRDLEKTKNLAESKRLFYVALTRARERLTLVCPEIGDPLEDSIRDKIYSDDYWRGWLECAGVSLPRASLPAPESSQGSESSRDSACVTDRNHAALGSSVRGSRVSPWPIPLMRARHSVTEWALLARCPRTYEWKYIRRKEVPAAEGSRAEELQIASPVELPPELPLELSINIPVERGLKTNETSKEALSQKELGSRVHKILEEENFESLEEGLKTLEQEVGSARFLALPVIQWAKSHPQILFSDSDAGREVFSELNFEVPVNGQVLVGTMDRVILHGRGSGNLSAQLVDFKITTHSSSRRALLEAYQTQMELYAWALTRLEPELSPDQIVGTLITLSPEGVRSVSVPWAGKGPGTSSRYSPSQLLASAQEIIAGQVGEPRPGSYCRFCEFQAVCPEAMISQKNAVVAESMDVFPSGEPRAQQQSVLPSVEDFCLDLTDSEDEMRYSGFLEQS